MSQKPNNNLHDAGTAVADFLDVLLQEATITPEKQKPHAEPARVLLMPEVVLEAAPEPEQPPPVVEQKIEAKSEAIPVPEVEDVSAPDAQADEPETAPAPLQPAADRYQYPLQCLMFSVGEHQLSIPLIDLGSVLPLTQRLTQLPGTPDWFLGILQHRDDRVKVVDSAKFLHIPVVANDQSERHLLVFGDESWAICCDKLGQVLQLEKEDVHWSPSRTNGYALGTLRESLAILLDSEKLLQHLNRQIS